MARLKKLILRVRGIFPSALPKGLSDFNIFAEDIFNTYDFPNHPSYRHAIATMIMHLHPLCHKKSKAFFARGIRKSQANEVAFEVLRILRDEEKKTAKMAETKIQEELPPVYGDNLSGKESN